MKHAKIYEKDEVGRTQYKGEAILLNEMEHTHTRGFWEYKFLDSNVTHCGWIENSQIYEK